MAYGRAKPLARSLFELVRRRSGAAEGPLSVRWHAGAGAGETTGEEAVLIQNALHSSRTHIKLKSSPVQPPPRAIADPIGHSSSVGLDDNKRHRRLTQRSEETPQPPPPACHRPTVSSGTP